jgi:hypothetical protein
MVQDFRLGLLIAILGVVVPGCGDGCKQSGDKTDVGRPCKAGTPADIAYICPTGYFCKFTEEQDMLKPSELGKCEAMEQYKPCMNITPCSSADFSPKCPSVLDAAYCDWYQTSLRCKCESPGPFVEGGDDADVKTPTTN